MARKTPKKPFVDDGRVIADMNVDGMPWYRSKKHIKRDEELQELELTRKERRAMIFAAYKVLLPYCLMFIGMFVVAFLLVMLWLK